MTTAQRAVISSRREALARRVRLLVAATITWNLVEAAVALAASASASSAALLGFGLDSVVEVSSATALGWQFAARDQARRQDRERAALRVTAVSFFALAVLVAADAARALAGSGEARPSLAGAGDGRAG
jgi:hypothetical protein